MRAINITLRPHNPTTLPLAYNVLVQGLLYSCWKDAFPKLHDEGFGPSRQFRMFTFGPLHGRSSIDKSAKTISFKDVVEFEVRSPFEELLDELARQLSLKSSVRLGSCEMDLANLQSCDRLLFPRRAVLRMRAPVVAYDTLNDGHTRYYSPEEQDWNRLIKANVASKAEAFSLQCNPDILIIPRAETLRKQVTKFKGTLITGWTGDLIVAANPQVLSLLYYTGLGVKNSQGFGLFNILNERA